MREKASEQIKGEEKWGDKDKASMGEGKRSETEAKKWWKIAVYWAFSGVTRMQATIKQGKRVSTAKAFIRYNLHFLNETKIVNVGIFPHSVFF
jgi:hypothetical protein